MSRGVAALLALPTAFAAAAPSALASADPTTGGTLAPLNSQPATRHALPRQTGGTPALPAAGARPPRVTPSPAPAQPPIQPGAGRSDIPARYLSLYRAAGSATGVDWRVLAAIGKNESNHGRSRAPGVTSGVNFAGCCSGPMQICTIRACGKVWQHYAADGDLDGRRSVYSPPDAILGAATIVRDLSTWFGQDPKLLLAAYNAGPGNVRRYRGVPPFPETQGYVAAGLRYVASLR